MISIIFPAYNEEHTVAELHARIMVALSRMGEPFEIIAVNNASVDGTRERLMRLSPIRIISLAYNIGQSAGVDAGLHAARGDLVVVLDADLQNDPEDIPLLIGKLREGGYDAVMGWRKDRHDSSSRRLFSRIANGITRLVSGVALHDFGCALKVFKRAQVADIHLYGVMHVFIPVILSYRGARIAEMPVRHSERRAGTSNYSFTHMASDIADLLAIKFLYGYATRPLVFFGSLTVVSFVSAFLVVCVASLLKWNGLFGVTLGFSQTPLPVLASLLVILGFLLFMLGFVVELLIRIYYEARHATPYQIQENIERN